MSETSYRNMEASSTPAGSALDTPPSCWAALGHSIRLDDAMLLLGIGSFGVVLSACVKAQQGLSVLTAAPADPSSEGERVALKLIVGSQPHVTASARHERDTLAALPAHDNIVRLTLALLLTPALTLTLTPALTLTLALILTLALTLTLTLTLASTLTTTPTRCG